MNASSSNAKTATMTAKQLRYLFAITTRGHIYQRVVTHEDGTREQHVYLVVGYTPCGGEVTEKKEVPAATFKKFVSNGWISAKTINEVDVCGTRICKTHWYITDEGRAVIRPPATKESVGKLISKLHSETGWLQFDMERDNLDRVSSNLASLERLLKYAQEEVARLRNQQ